MKNFRKQISYITVQIVCKKRQQRIGTYGRNHRKGTFSVFSTEWE